MLEEVVPEAGIEPVRDKISRDFKSRASASSAIPANFLKGAPSLARLLYHSRLYLSTPFVKNLLTKDAKFGILSIEKALERQVLPWFPQNFWNV